MGSALGRKHTVDETHQRRGRDAGEHSEPKRGVVLQKQPRDDAGKSNVVAHRQVQAARDQQNALTHRDDAERGGLAQDVLEIVDAEEAGGLERGGDDDQHHDSDRPERIDVYVLRPPRGEPSPSTGHDVRELLGRTGVAQTIASAAFHALALCAHEPCTATDPTVRSRICA